MSRRSHFETIRSEGALLPPDLLQRIAERDKDLGGLRGEDYGLPPNEPLNEAIVRSYNRLVGAWGSFREAWEKLPEGDPGTSVTRDRWLLVLLQELGYGRVQTSSAVEIEGRSYAVSHAWENVPMHLIGCNVPLGTRSKGVAGASNQSPHGTLQELLNRSDERLWGIVSNGLQLRLLRDNSSLTRQAFVEFDLEQMLDGDTYSDFALLWMLCHASRVEGDRPHECWLERWSQEAQKQGTRALEGLRKGVEEAISALGSGFLRPGRNAELKAALRSGELTAQDYYRELLRLVYRLLFLFVAEDRKLLHHPDAPEKTRDRYAEWYSTQRLRRLAERRRGTKHGDLWESLQLVMRSLAEDDGCPALGLPALGSFLWSSEAISHLRGASLPNGALLDAIRALATVRDGKVLRSVDYKNLGAEELGSVYESLLELHPDLDADAGTFALTTTAGNERKTTGSYYTPSSLIACLLDSALDPVLGEAAAKGEDAILELKVCDPACGSGHFLVAAAHRIAKRLASVRTGDEEPSPEATRHALRDVVSRCLYGVDVNPMAVELCKVSLWMEALDPGRPLSFLDAHVKCGNSLVGTTMALMNDGIPDEAFKALEGDDKEIAKALRKQNKAEREGQLTLEDLAGGLVASLEAEADVLEETTDDTPEALHEKERRFAAFAASDVYERARLAADAWCAAFVQRKVAGAPRITTGVVRRIASGGDVPDDVRNEVVRLAHEYRFLHWEIEFPQVFGREGAGVDVVSGNPPYVDSEVLKREEPRIREFVTCCYRAATGNWDLFIPFVELGARLLRRGGHQALLTPVKIIASDYAQAVQELLLGSRMVCVHDFSRLQVFDDADVAVCSVAFASETPDPANTVPFLTYSEDWAVDRAEDVLQTDLLALPKGYLGFPLNQFVDIPMTLFRQGLSLADLASLSDGASTSEAYEIRDLIEELDRPWDDGDESIWLRLVNTGTIDPFEIRWGKVVTRYLKTQWQFPVVSIDGLRRAFPRRAAQGTSPKVLVAGLAARIEAVADKGTALCGKSAVLVLPGEGICPYGLCAVLNTTLASEVYRALFGLRGFSPNSMAIGPRQLEQLPLPALMRDLLRPSEQLGDISDQHLKEEFGRDGLRAAVGATLLSSIGQIVHRELEKGRDTQHLQDLAERIVRDAYESPANEVPRVPAAMSSR